MPPHPASPPRRGPDRPFPALPRPLRACLCAALLLSCDDGPAAPPPGIPATLVITPRDMTLTAIGQTGRLRAEVLDHHADVVAGQRVAWTSDRPGTAMVDWDTGVVTAVATGSATVTATSGALAAQVPVIVIQEPHAIEKVAGDLQVGFIGERLPLAAIVRVTDAGGHPAGLASVRFAVTSGGGSVTLASTQTNAAGLAQTAWTLGTAAEHTLTVTSGSVTTEFRATGERLPLTIETDSLPRARLTLPYALTLRARGGSTEGYAWSLGEGGSLPAGLRLDSGGTIQGVPEDTATVAVEVRLVDSEGTEAVRGFTLRACDAPLGLRLGEVRVFEAGAIRGCGFHVRVPEAGAYYRVTLVGTDPTEYDGREAGTEGVVPVALRVEADSAAPGRVTAAATRPRVDGVATARTWRQGAPDRELREIREIERANAALHGEMRRQERELFSRLAAQGRLATLPDRSREVRAVVAADGRPSPPTRTFRLYNPTAEPAARCGAFATLNARLVTENPHIAIYEDAEETGGISKTNADRILAFYAAHGAPVIERYFGA